MPELPEVETIARAIRARVTSAQVARVRAVDHPHWVEARGAQGATVQAVRRLGKHLLLDLDAAWTLDVHLGMTGNLRLREGWRQEAPETHERMRLRLVSATGDLTLQLVDSRGFGHVRLGERSPSGAVHLPSLERMGPDAWEAWTPAHLRAAARGRTAPIKALLLDQQVVAGIGNYVADEALFRARVHPATAAGRVSAPALGRLHGAVREVLGRSIELQGATLRDYRGADGERGGMQDLLLAYGRVGQGCVECGRPMEKTRVAGRGTTFCPRCQRLRS